ncbi:MAG TPA: MMPL family transporter [Pirellulales bacterium]|nr:MMPL family transporter [Pirellulales bacterium]
MSDSSSEPQPSLLSAPLDLATRVALRFPAATVALAVALTVFSVAYTWQNLSYRTSRLDLLNPESDYNRLWIDYVNEFGEEDDAVVVVEGASRERVVPVLEEISTMLAREDRLFHAVLHGVDLGQIRAKGLHYLSQEELLGIEQFLDSVSPIIDEGNWSPLNLGRLLTGVNDRLEATQVRPGLIDPGLVRSETERLTDSLLGTLTQKDRYQSPWPAMPQSFATLSELNAEYLLTKDGTLGFVLLRLAQDPDGFARNSQAVDALRDLIAQVNARHPDAKVGLTGLPVMENDEMRSSETSMYWSSLLSLVGVACLFVAGFGGVRHALLANLVLLVGIAWSFAYLTFTIGHLNILSMSFTVTLIGIGIDYGVYYVARYLQIRATVASCKDALLQTTHAVGAAILTGAVTTAISFFAASFTDFTGIAELGTIAGGGILLCAVAELLVLPAVIAMVDRSGLGMRIPEPLNVHSWIAPLLRRPRLLLASTMFFTLVVSLGVEHLWYDHNLLNLQAEGLESIELEQKLLSESNQSVWYALSIADNPDDLLARKEAMLKLDSVERVEEIVSLLPGDHKVKQPIIARIQKRLANLAERPQVIPVDKPDYIGRVLARTQQLMAVIPETRGCARDVEQIRDRLRKLVQSDYYQWLSHFQQNMAGDLLSRLHILRSMANPEKPELSDLPQSLVQRFVGNHGHHLLKIYGRGNIWDMDALEKFVKEVRSVDPRATGNPLQAYEASLEMKSSYEEAALYALLVIMVVLVVDLRSVRYALLAALPLGLGVLQTFGLLGILEIPLNPANMIALPLMLGIGVDYGVHLIHEYREQSGPYRMSPATAVAVLVDGLTTVVGFGSLMIASHRGLQSLGRVLTLGVTCCMFTSMIMLPALLVLMSRKRRAAAAPASSDEAPREPVRLPSSRRIDGPEPHIAGRHTAPRRAASPERSPHRGGRAT